MNFTGFPPSDKSFAGVQEDTLDRLSRVERRRRKGGGGETVLAPAFMTPTSVSGGTFDPATGRITLAPGATGVTINGVFTSQYRAYKIIFGWYTGTSNGLVIRLCQNGVPDQAAIYEYASAGNSGNAAFGAENNTQTFWGLAAIARPGHAGEITVFEPMTTEFTNNQKRYVAVCTAYGDAVAMFGGIMAGRDTTPYDGFTILNSAAGPGVTAQSGSWVMVIPIPTSQVPSSGGGSGGAGHAVGDIWQIGDAAVPPAGTLICDGRAVSRTTYAELFARIGTKYGAGDGSTTFNLPSLNAVQASNSSTSVSRIALDGLFPTLSQNVGNIGPDYWDIYYSIDLPGTAGNELRGRFRSNGADITANAYFHARDGFANGTNLQGYVNQDYFEPGWGNVFNISGVLRVYRAGKPNDWTNFDGNAAMRGSVYTQGTVEVGGSLQQASDIDGIVFYTGGGGYVIGTVLAIPAGGSTAPSVIAYMPSGGSPVPVAVPNKGTTAERNAMYPLPANTTQQVALHNQKVQWQNTETGWTEQYFAPSNLAGVNAPGLIVDAAAPSGYPAGWYPVAGSLILATFIKNNGFQAAAGGTKTAPTLSVVLNNTQSKFSALGASGIIASIAGFYDMSYSVYYSGAGAMLYISGFVEYAGGAEIVSQRIPGNAADMQVQGAVQGVRVSAGQGIQLMAMPSAANNIYGDGVTRRTFLTLSYAGPPLVGI